MKEDVSAFMDGTLGAREAEQCLDELLADPEQRKAWSLYHLIGDALRQSLLFSPDFSGRVMASLESEIGTAYRVGYPLVAEAVAPGRPGML